MVPHREQQPGSFEMIHNLSVERPDAARHRRMGLSADGAGGSSGGGRCAR
jgi:hypothetical protein